MKLLATVISSAEAKLIADLVDLIDVKDPSKGPLGAAGLVTVHSIRSAVGSHAPLSVALGELDPNNVGGTVELGRLMAGAGATMLKVGLSNIKEQTALKTLTELKKALSDKVAVAAVAYADGDELGFFPYFALPGIAKDAGLDGIMLDTYTKGENKSLLDYISSSYIKTIIDEGKNLGLKTALAGGLDLQHIDEISRISPDWIGFRAAITTEGVREKIGIDRSKVNKLKMMIRLAAKKNP